MVEETRGKKSNKNFKKLLICIEANLAINNTCNKQRKENQYRPFRHTKLHKKHREIKHENKVAQIELERIASEDIRERVYTYKDGSYGKIPKHSFLLLSIFTTYNSGKFLFSFYKSFFNIFITERCNSYGKCK